MLFNKSLPWFTLKEIDDKRRKNTTELTDCVSQPTGMGIFKDTKFFHSHL